VLLYAPELTILDAVIYTTVQELAFVDERREMESWEYLTEELINAARGSSNRYIMYSPPPTGRSPSARSPHKV